MNCPQELDNQVIVDWRSQHPVLQYVNLTNLFALKSRKLQLPRDAEVLAEFNESPALALVRRQGSTYLLAGFDILQSNWPFEPSFVLFCYNAVSFLGAQVGSGGRHELAVGEPIAIESVPAETVLTLTRPDATTVELTPDPGGTVRFPARSASASTRSKRPVSRAGSTPSICWTPKRAASSRRTRSNSPA